MKYINSKESMFCLCCIIQCGIKWLIIHAKTLKGGLGKVVRYLEYYGIHISYYISPSMNFVMTQSHFTILEIILLSDVIIFIW